MLNIKTLHWRGYVKFLYAWVVECFPNLCRVATLHFHYLHRMKYWFIAGALLFSQVQAQVSTNDLTQYVNPFIGTGGHGHTFPGATLPFGMVQLSPDTRADGYNDWDGCGGYHYSDSIIYGFSHTHLSGTGVADYCDVLLMPTVGEIQMNSMSGNDPKTGYASAFSHQWEKASPGYYEVALKDDNIGVALTSTLRTGMHQYFYPATNQANVILDLRHRDKLLDGSYIEVISPTKVQGLRRSSSWASDQWIYFAIEFSQPFTLAGVQDSNMLIKTAGSGFKPIILSGNQLTSFFRFISDGKKPLLVKCALSPVSCAGAWNNMAVENPGWDFNAVKKQATETWNAALSKILVESPTDKQLSLSDPSNKLVIFYTALYHCMIAPNIYEDADGRYRSMRNQISITPDHTQYTVFSLWDTFRALHPLFTIIEPERTNDFINTFLKQYQDGGRLPVWELSANETNCMIGYHSVSVIADAAVKGYSGFDRSLALEAMMHSANTDLYGLKTYRNKGFLESNEEPESVSKTMEYAYDDWCIAQMSLLVPQPELHNESDGYHHPVYDEFINRGYGFLHMLNDEGFAQPRFNGGWYTPFDPFEVNFNYTEANSWQYSFFYPQYLPYFNTDAKRKVLEERLDKLFSAHPKTTGREQADITGLIGQYAHGNEPSHHIAYLYNYAGAPWKTEEKIREICTTFYKNAPDGLIGNEDCGQMSAWYVMSALGLYQVCPGDPEYTLTTPLFPQMIVNTGKPFVVKCEGDPAQMPYIEKVELGFSELNEPIVTHKHIMQGGGLFYTLSSKPNTSWGTRPVSTSPLPRLPEKAPILNAPAATFSSTMDIHIDHQEDQYIEYTINDGPIKKYSEPIHITENTVIKARAFNKETHQTSPQVTAHYSKIPDAYTVTYKTPYNSQYTAGGNTALIDGLKGSSDFRTGQWQGWWGDDMIVQLDLGSLKQIDTIGGEFLQDVRSWIWMPKELQIRVSIDGRTYTDLGSVKNTVPMDDYDSKLTQSMELIVPVQSIRYIQFTAKNAGTVPDWHPGKGGKSWIFSDEVWAK